MGGPRALIASLGASISLVAGAAVSLLFVSVIFALPGITGGSDAPGASAAVVVESQPLRARSAPGGQARETASAVVISAPEPARGARRPSVRKTAVVPVAAEAAKPTFNPTVRDLRPPAPPAASAPPVVSKPAIGDGVRDVGDAVSATVKSTGEAAAPLLGPPVSKVVQDVLDLLSAVLQGATSTLGGVLDKAVPR